MLGNFVNFCLLILSNRFFETYQSGKQIWVETVFKCYQKGIRESKHSFKNLQQGYFLKGLVLKGLLI